MTELKLGLTIVTCMVVIPFLCFVLVGYVSNQQRYSTFLESQRTVLECRAAQTNPDRICGPIPTFEQFQ